MERLRKVLQDYNFHAAGWIILVHELLERFSFYGMKAILSIYLTENLKISESNTTMIYHLFSAISYLLPVVGAIISDNYLGRFKTIAIFGIVYLIGHALMPLTALKTNIAGPMAGLFILAVGTGMIKPCVSAFGGDQIDETNALMLDNYFSLFYACINIGAFIAQIITPILRKDVKCINDACYPLAFGVPAIVFLIAYVLFLAGKPLYRFAPHESNVLTKFCKCIAHAIGRWFRDRKTVKKPELLDYADDEYDKDFIVDSKKALSVIVLFLPFPIFWALFDQQGSTWTFQATSMNGYLYSSVNDLKPDQMQSFNPLFIVAAIPLFNVIIYPLLTKCNVLKSAPSRMVTGYFFAALSFIITGFVQIAIDQTFRIIPDNLAQLSIVNYGQYKIPITSSNSYSLEFILPAKGSKTINLKEDKFFSFNASYTNSIHNIRVPIQLGRLTTVYLHEKNVKLVSDSTIVKENVEGGFTKLKMFIGFSAVPNSSFVAVSLSDNSKSVLFKYNGTLIISDEFIKLKRGSYHIYSEKNSMPKIKLEITESALTTLGIFNDSSKGFHLVKSVHLKADEIHMLWQLPQYIVMVFSEVFLSVTALSFAYTAAPSSMKALIQAAYLVTVFAGNLIVVFVEAVSKSLSASWQFFVFAILVSIGGVINGLLAWRFLAKQKNQSEKQVEPNQVEPNKDEPNQVEPNQDEPNQIEP